MHARMEGECSGFPRGGLNVPSTVSRRSLFLWSSSLLVVLVGAGWMCRDGGVWWGSCGSGCRVHWGASSGFASERLGEEWRMGERGSR